MAIVIQISAPVARDGAWWCDYEIGWPSGTQMSAGAGSDAVQAMFLTMEKIGAEIYTSVEHREGRLVWHKPGNGYGFPVPKNIRHMLVGDDASYG